MADDAKVEIDVSKVEEAFERMDPKKFKSAIRSSFRKGTNVIKKDVRSVIKSKYPGTTRNLPDHQMGQHFWWHKNKNIVQYGELEKDVKSGVWKSAKGAFVVLAPNKKNNNRGAVLNWLNNGTNPRGNERSSYVKVSGDSKHRSYRKFQSTGGEKNLGRISPSNFFGSVASGASSKASEAVAESIAKNVIKAYNNDQQNNN